jgi:josephin
MKSTSTLLAYHEKQSRWDQLCLVHALNMLMGSKQVDQDTLDVICERLAPDSSPWWNPHRSALGLGNYDANVALTVLQEHGLETTFFDNRKPVDELLARLGELEGLLANISGSMMSLPGSRHWIAYRPTVVSSPTWWILDSKQAGPIQVDSMEHALADHVSKGDYIIMVQKQA